MQGIKYDWKRFWCPRTGAINLSDGGYLYDPDSEYGNLYNPHVVSFESISDIPCLGLLGEPGAGKTHAMQEVINTIEKEKITLFVDLRSCGSETSLYRNLFEHPIFKSWTQSDYELHLFLDSLDECLLRIDYVIPLLIDEFKKYPTQRLFLRISCRTAEWPNILEEGLIHIWGKESVKVYELAPLRRMDIEEAIKVHKLNVEEFLVEVREKEVTSFAIKPVTLNLLLNQFRKEGKLPYTQRELYLRGCELLCEETNENRIISRKKGNLTSKDRLTVASQIAAITVFSNKYAVWRGINLGNVPEEDVTLHELSYGGDRQISSNLVISEADIEETITTGLFTSRGNNRLGWAHQTYAEFLAALYLIENNLTLKQIINLLEHPADNEGKLVPQLHEVSAWLASMNIDVFNEIVKREPQVLLRSDVASVNNEYKILLVDGLLKHYEEEKIINWDQEIERRYFKLYHPQLAEQLKPYIIDRYKGPFVRRAAILIAEACKLKNLIQDILSLAIDSTELLQIRVTAAHVVKELGEEAQIVKLLPLARSEAGDDPEDDLKGIALSALWPNYITAEELFPLLTPKKKYNYIGAYRMFLSHKLIKQLKVNDLPFALRWIKSQPSIHELEVPFNEFVHQILRKGWDYFDAPNVLNFLAEAVLSRLKFYDELSFYDEIQSNKRKRRTLILTLLNMDEDMGKVVGKILHSPLIITEDLPWMIEYLLKADLREQQIWAELVCNNFNTSDPLQVELVYKTAKEVPTLAVICEGFFQAIQLDSEQAKELRERHLKLKERKKRLNKRISFGPSLEKISEYLDEFELGSLDAWWKLNWYMAKNSDGSQLNELESDLTALYGWEIADCFTKRRIISAARIYILEKDDDSKEWFGTNTFHRPAYAGFCAFQLLLKYDEKFALTLSKEVWEKWIRLIMTYPVSTDNSEIVRNKLVELAYTQIPIEIIEILLFLIDKENKKHNYIFILRAVEGCWDNQLTKALLSKVKDNSLKINCMDSILEALLKKNVEEAFEYAKSLISSPLPVDKTKRAKAVIAARELIIKAGKKEWEKLWSVIQKNPEFGREVMFSIATSNMGYGDISHLPEKNVADLYIWLVQQFPFEEDPNHDNERMAHFVGKREEVGNFRDSLLRLLKSKGTIESRDEIKRIIKEIPGVSWLKWTLLEAESITRRHTWNPPRPKDVIQLAANRSNRFIQSGEQLLEVLIESLERLEEKLHGETPDVRWLWNHLGKEKYKPCTENEFSDYIKRHFEDDLRGRGIIVNREVEIRRGYGMNQGERTDIQVNAVLRGQEEDYQTLSAIIEVKGNWHNELNEAMQTQLSDRYLKDNVCQFGLYLVGWFSSESWEDEHRKKRVPKIALEEARVKFRKQAEKLSSKGKRIKSFILDVRL